MSKTLLTCTCAGSQEIDFESLAEQTGLNIPSPLKAMCTSQIAQTQEALQNGDVILCCTQERRRFETVADELGIAPPAFLDLRDRCGWSDDPQSKIPKMSALIAEAMLPAQPEKTIDVVSEGVCLILGNSEVALSAAAQLSDFLNVTVLLEKVEDIPDQRDYNIVIGKLRGITGALGNFSLTIDKLQLENPEGRGAITFSDPRDGGHSECDILLDFRGLPPLFPAHEKREGYLRADPNHPPAVASAIMEASHLVGIFEKTLYIQTQPHFCAHSRAEKTACSRCLNLCPTGAITSAGEYVTVDPLVCAGCGACSAVCPSGAISYDAPSVDLIMQRIQTLAKAYLEAGGSKPRLLVHDDYGTEMIQLAARHGRGLPADVIPFELSAIGAFGHAESLAALAAGFISVHILPGPKVDRAPLTDQINLANALAAIPCVFVLETQDPDSLSNILFTDTTIAASASVNTPIRPLGTRRQIARQAAKALNPESDFIPLPEGAPYGNIILEKSACTLCLSCVSLCPSGALGDNPDKPQLRFQEDACLQCGLCAKICPENAIQYEARLNLTDAALSQQILNEEEPFACVECGSLFGSKSAIDRITERLTGHSMFANPEKLRMIQMCDDCRVNAHFHSDNNPFSSSPRRKPRTTDDYIIDPKSKN